MRHVPKYCLKKSRNLAYVTINGKQKYLGRYGTPQSKMAYARVIKEWKANQCEIGATCELPHPSIGQLFLKYIDAHPSRVDEPWKIAIRPLFRKWRHTPCDEAGLWMLLQLQENMALVNDAEEVAARLAKLIRVFLWGVQQRDVLPSIYAELSSITPISQAEIEQLRSQIKPRLREHRCRYRHTFKHLADQINLIPLSGDQGYLYAGTADDLLKIGMVIRQCPFCRMARQKITPLAIQFSEDCIRDELYLLERLGLPARGREWFDEPEKRLQLLLSEGLLQDCLTLESELLIAFEAKPQLARLPVQESAPDHSN